jgi:hypothetical protein
MLGPDLRLSPSPFGPRRPKHFKFHNMCYDVG